MTSTTVYKGSFGEKPSSRVLQPPGGGSSNIFGSNEDNQEPLKASVPYQGDVLESFPLPSVESKTKPQDAAAAAAAALSSNALEERTGQSASLAKEIQPSATRNRSSGFNPITGEPYVAVKAQLPDAENAKQTASITVRQPPGGASSGLW